MVTTGSLLLFLTASIPLILFPGPSVAFILATTLRAGRRSGLAATAGVETGYLVHVLGAVVGLSAVIAASAAAVHRRQGARRGLAAVDGLAQPAGPVRGDAGRPEPADGRA